MNIYKYLLEAEIFILCEQFTWCIGPVSTLQFLLPYPLVRCGQRPQPRMLNATDVYTAYEWACSTERARGKAGRATNLRLGVRQEEY